MRVVVTRHGRPWFDLAPHHPVTRRTPPSRRKGVIHAPPDQGNRCQAKIIVVSVSAPHYICCVSETKYELERVQE